MAKKQGGRPSMPPPQVAVSPRADGKCLILVSLANERHEPRYGVPVTLVVGGEVKQTTSSDSDGNVSFITDSGVRVIIQGPVFVVERELEKTRPKPIAVKFPAAPNNLSGFLDAIRRAWQDSRTLKKGGTP